MDSTPFSKRCEIIKDLSELYIGLEWVQDFVSWHNLGVPWAIGSFYGDITLNERGIEYVNETWNALLKSLSVDDDNFDSVTDLLEASSVSW